MDWFDELFNGGDNENQERTVSHQQLNKLVEIIPSSVLRGLDFKEVKIVPDDSIYIGTVMDSYGDWNYFITTEGNVVARYYDIGD